MIANEGQDVIRRAKDFYEQRLRADLEKTNLNDFLAVEPDSGQYFLGATLSEAAYKARQALPGKRCFLIRVGHRSAVFIGTHQ